MPNDRLYFNALNQIPSIGSVRFRKIMGHFPSMAAAWAAGAAELAAAGLEENVVADILGKRSGIDPEKEYARLEAQNVQLLTHADKNYPKLLREIPQSPMVLYCKGASLDADETAVAVVGTRKMSPYGRQAAADIARGLTIGGVAVVSGLALGVDSVVHRAVVESSGRTIAVLACGLDSVYPASNRQIAERITAAGGTLVSELPLGTPPLKHHFAYRNRIISGLCLGTVVIEAAAESGALITARHALEQNRQVYTVPGSIYSPGSVGPHNLLKMGAKPVTDAADVLEDLNLVNLAVQEATKEIIADNDEEAAILKLLTREPKHFDHLAKSAGLPASTVAATLTIMEMKGKVRNLGANQYVLSR